MTRISLATLVSLAILASTAYADVTIDHFNNPGSAAWYENQANVTAYVYDTVDVPDGSAASVKMTYRGDGDPWWGQLQGQYPTPLDLSAETTIRFWAKGSVPGMTLDLVFAVPDWVPGGSVATAGPFTTLWARYEVPISQFVIAPYYSGGTAPVNWSTVSIFQSAPHGQAGDLWIDQIEAIGATGILVPTTVPRKGATVAELPNISVTFSKAVTGVDAADLRVSGNAATAVTGSGAGPYVFSGFAQPGVGVATVSLGPGGITAGTDVLVEQTWTYSIVQRVSGVCYFTDTPPTIDGNFSASEWPIHTRLRFNDADGTISGVEDLSGYIYTQHDRNNLYVAVNITDDEIAPISSATNWWEDDSVEIFVDNDHDRTLDAVESTTGSIGKLSTNWNVTVVGGETGLTGPGAGMGWNVLHSRPSTNNYVMEFIISKTAANNLASSNVTVGFDVQVQDRDTTVASQGRIWWTNSIDTTAWDNEYAWGDLFLSPETSPGQPLAIRSRSWNLYK